MDTLSRTALACAAGLLVLGPSTAAQTPSFDLVIGPAEGAARVYALSADGNVAAGWTSPSGLGFTWTRAGGRVDYGTDITTGTSTTSAISGDGLVVGGSSRSNASGQFRAFRWSGPGTFQQIGVPPGNYIGSTVLGLSGDGSLAVGSADGPQGSFRQAFRWTEPSGLVPMGWTRLNHFYSEAKAVSRDGRTIVGESYGDFGGDAFLWTQVGGLQVLPALTPNSNSSASAVNVDGSVIVGRSGAFAAMWRHGQVMSLGFANGWSNSQANGVSDSGDIVVGSMSGIPSRTASIWTPQIGMEPLSNYLLRNGVEIPAGWALATCYAVSEDGKTFAGYATSSIGLSQGFVATVPAPSASVVLLLTVSFTSCRRRRRR